MAYLRLYDYAKSIQDVQLNQIIASNDSLRLLSELDAQDEATSYLKQKYDTEAEFRDTTVFDQTATYKANDLVEINYSEYASTTSYVSGNKVIYQSKGYICTASTTGTFDPTKWTLLGNKYDLYYVTVPKSPFNYKTIYKAGDEVFYKDKVYTAALPTPLPDHQTAMQYGRTNYVPALNVAPDDPVDGATYWGLGTAYTVAGSTLPTDTTKWTKGDNRSRQLVRKLVDICLYYLHDRISPRNIPQLRKDHYAAAIAWLDMAKDGELAVDIPIRQPRQGWRMRWSSEIRRVNDY